MKNATLLVIAAVLIVGCNLFDVGAVYETADIRVSAGTSAGSARGSDAARAISPSTSPDEIARIELRISGEDKYGVERDPLVETELGAQSGTWTTEVADLPIGPMLTFEAVAFGSSGQELYGGSTTTSIAGSGEVIVIVLYPVDDGQPPAFPVVEKIRRPAEIVRDQHGTVAIELAGTSGDVLSVQLLSGGGGFSPSEVDVSLSAGGTATLEVTYTAPSAVGSYDHEVVVANAGGNSVRTAFDTTVVYETSSADVEVGFAPAVVGISGSRTADEIEWFASVTDDGPASDLRFDWSFDGPASFADHTANPAVLTGYAESVSGTVTVTVTDADGYATSVAFDLVAGQFPDSVVEDSDESVPSLVFAGSSSIAQLSVIDADTNTVVDTVSLPSRPIDLIISRDWATLYVLGYSDALKNHTFVAVDIETLTVLDPIVDLGGWAVDFVLSLDESLAYVGLRDDPSERNSVVEIDLETMTATGRSVAVGYGIRRIAIEPDGDGLWVSQFGAINTPSSTEILRIDRATMTTDFAVGVGAGPSYIEFSDDGSQIYVANAGSSYGTVSFVDPAARTEEALYVRGPSPDSIARVGDTLYTANVTGGTISVVDIPSRSVVGDPIRIGNSDYVESLTLSPDNRYAYVASMNVGRVYVLDLDTRTVIDSIPVAGNPRSVVARPAN